MKIFDAVLNVYFLLLVLLFLTGGYLPGGDYRRDELVLALSEMGPWVGGFLFLLLLRHLRDRDGSAGRIAFVRLLRSVGARLKNAPSAVYLVATIWACLLAIVAVRRLMAFEAGPDIDIFDQALWNTTQGRFYRSSIVGDVNLLSEHFDPLELLLVPLYFIHPSPIILLVVQAFMLSLGAIPLYWLARERFPKHLLATLFPILYLLYLPLREASRNDYHPGALVPPFFLFALYFMEKSRWRPMIVFLVLAGLLKENMPIAGAMIGIYLFCARRKRILGAALVLCFGLWFYANFTWIIPAFNPGGGGYKYFNLFTTFDGSARGVFLSPLLHPSGLIRGLAALAGRKLEYVLQVFGPLAFLSLLSPSRLFMGLPFLAQHLFSDARLMTTIETHHTADLLPFVFFSALWGASHLVTWLADHEVLGRRWERRRLSQALAAVLLASSFLFHGTPEVFYLRRYATTSHHQRIYTALREVPPDASVSAQPPIAPHLSYRPRLYHFPDLGPAPHGEAEYVILDETLIRRKTYRKLFVDGVAALPAKGYEKIRDEDGILVFRKHGVRP